MTFSKHGSACTRKSKRIGRWEKEEVVTWRGQGWREGDLGNDQTNWAIKQKWVGEVIDLA